MLAAQFYPQQPVLAISFPVTLQASMLSLNQPPHFPSLSSDPGRITSDFACSLVVVAPSSGYFQNKTSSAASVGPPTKGNDVSDAEAALDATVSNQPPRYVCPDEVDPADLFFCFDCGGAVSVTQWLNNGEANAKCGGVRESPAVSECFRAIH